MSFILGISIFTLVYAAIISEKINKAVAALAGASVMLLFHVVSQHEAFLAIDLNVILLLIGMMIIVHVMSHTGVFQWLAIRLAQVAKGEPLQLMIFLSVASALISAFLDNVTTMILLAPVTFLIADELELEPIPFLIIMVIASNLGGAATLVGDPPNILIGSAAGLSFNDFLFNAAPVIVIIMVAFIITIFFLFKRRFHVSSELKARINELRADRAIRNKPLLIKSVVVLLCVIVLFLLHDAFGLEAATIALTGASILLLISRADADETFKHVEWSTIFFFIGLFILVEGLVKIGFISLVAKGAIELTKGNISVTAIFLLWFSAICSAIIDNIPYTATMIPLVKEVGASIAENSGISAEIVFAPLWWSLALGACLGGNGTILGASANVIIVGLAKKNGHTITFWQFCKYGSLFVFESVVIATLYIYFRYLYF